MSKATAAFGAAFTACTNGGGSLVAWNSYGEQLQVRAALLSG
jgi:hypothetical protein